MLWKDEKEHLSESHKHYREIHRYRFWSRVGAFLLGCIFSFYLYTLLKPLTYDQEDRQKLDLIEQYYKEADKKISDINMRADYKRMLDQEREKILDKYTLPSLWGLLQFRGQKISLFVLLWLAPAFLAVGGYMLLKKKVFREWGEFFFPLLKTEAPLKMPGKVPLLWGQNPLAEKLFINEQEFRRAFGYAQGVQVDKVRDEIKALLNKISQFIDRFYPYENKSYLLYCYEVLLWHYVACLYANLPSGLMGKQIKDYAFKKLLSLYARNHLPVFLDVNGRFIKEEYDAYILCRIFYECDRVLRLRETLSSKFNPLPFVLNV